MINAKRKGNVGERECIDRILEVLGRNKTNGDKRNSQANPWGGSGTSDISVRGLEKLHLEVKNTKAVKFFEWIKQLILDVAGTSRLPILMYRMPAEKHPARRVEWFIFHRLSDVDEYVQIWAKALGYTVTKIEEEIQ